MATVGQVGTGLVPNYAFNTKTATTEAGGPTTNNDVTPTPLGDINNLPRDGQPATLPLDNTTPTAPTTPGNSTPPTGGGGKIDEQHRGWSSIGDPHITMGNEKFDNTRVGEFMLMESQDKSFQVQARQDKFGDGSVANTAAAVKDGDNVVSYDVKDKKLMVNGKEWDGKTQPPGGMKIEKTGDGYSVTSSKGDVTSIHDKGHYLDLDGKVGPDRQVGEVKGAHGVFDNVDTDESHIKRDGTKAANNDEMIDSWKVGQGESLFNKANAGGPAAADNGQTPKPLDPTGGTGGAAPAPAPANPAPANPADPAKPADPAAPQGPDGKGGPEANADIKKALQDILTQLKDLIANLTKVMEKLGIKVDAPAAGGGAAPVDPKAADPKAAEAKAVDGKGGPAAAPANFADQKKADGANDAAGKTFAEQKKEDEAKAAAAAGKGGPAAAAAPAAAPKAAEAKPADPKAADAKPADPKAADVKAGGPAAAADPLQEILNQLKDLIKGLTALIEKLGAAQGAAPQAAPVQPAAAEVKKAA